MPAKPIFPRALEIQGRAWYNILRKPMKRNEKTGAEKDLARFCLPKNRFGGGYSLIKPRG